MNPASKNGIRSYDFELAESPTQPAWDLVGTSPDAPDIFVQVKVGGQGYADEVVDAMQEDPNIGFCRQRRSR